MLDSHALVQNSVAHCNVEPVYLASAELWMYGNIKLLGASLSYVEATSTPPHHDDMLLSQIEREAEQVVLNGDVLVCGVHNFAHRRAAIVPLRWGSPRLIVFSGGIRFHLGHDLSHEPFRSARLWRYRFDAMTDLVVSRRAPDKLPTFASYNPTIDKLIERLTTGLASRIAASLSRQ